MSISLTKPVPAAQIANLQARIDARIMKHTHRRLELHKQWFIAPQLVRDLIMRVARHPSESNATHAVGYLAALIDTGHIVLDNAYYFVVVAGALRTDEDMRNLIISEYK